jgi:hypothetical protein
MIPIARSVASAAVGAAAMFWLDPVRGRSRRAFAEEKVGSAAGNLTDAVGVAGRDLGHRAEGIRHRAHSWFAHEEVPDEVLTERVRSALGRVASHPRAIKVSTNNGRVTLKGAVLAHELPYVLDAVCTVRGVTTVSDKMAVHDDPRGVPELQGGRSRGPARSFLPWRWSPAARLLAGVSAGSLLLAGLWQLSGTRSRANWH